MIHPAKNTQTSE